MEGGKKIAFSFFTLFDAVVIELCFKVRWEAWQTEKLLRSLADDTEHGESGQLFSSFTFDSSFDTILSSWCELEDNKWATKWCYKSDEKGRQAEASLDRVAEGLWLLISAMEICQSELIIFKGFSLP